MSIIIPRIELGSLDFTRHPFGVEYGTDIGSVENVAQVIESFLTDGDFVLSGRKPNRQMVIPIIVIDDDVDQINMADAECRAGLEIEKPFNRLRISPGKAGAGKGFPSEFFTFRGELQFRRNDREEIAGIRRYSLIITALPQAFSTTVKRTPALASSATPATHTINAGSSASGWLLHPTGGAPAVVSGALELDAVMAQTGVTWDAVSPAVELTTAAVDMSDTIYVSVDVEATATFTSGFTPLATTAHCAAFADDERLTLVGAGPAPGGVGQRYTFLCPDTSVTKFRVEPGFSAVYTTEAATAPTVKFRVKNLIRTNVAPNAGSTDKQKVRALPVAGSLPTPGSLLVEHETSALGDVIVHTCPDFGVGYAPNIMRFYASGGTKTDQADNCSGVKVTGATVSMDALTRSLPPGTYGLAIRAKRVAGSGPVDVSWSATARAGGVSYGNAETGEKTYDPTAAYEIAMLGTVELPATAELMESMSSSLQRVTLTFSEDMVVDEVWLYFISDVYGNRGHISVAHAGTGAPARGVAANRLWIRSATVDHPLPGVYLGTEADGSDSWFAAGALWEQHEFPPPGLQVHTVTTNALNAETSFESRDAYHHNAAS